MHASSELHRGRIGACGPVGTDEFIPSSQAIFAHRDKIAMFRAKSVWQPLGAFRGRGIPPLPLLLDPGPQGYIRGEHFLCF